MRTTGLVDATAANAMVLLGGIDEVKIDRKGAYNVNSGVEVAIIDDGRNLVRERLDLALQLCSLRRGCLGQAFRTVAQPFAGIAQPLDRFKNVIAAIALYGLSQCVS